MIIQTSAVEPITSSDRDQDSVVQLIKEFDIIINLKFPFVHVNIRDLFDIDNNDDSETNIEYVDYGSEMNVNMNNDENLIARRTKRSADTVAEIATCKRIADIATVTPSTADIAEDWDATCN